MTANPNITQQDANEAETQPQNLARQGDPVSRTAIFTYDLVLVGLLVLVGALYIKFPETMKFGDALYKLAIESMWFGALGGVIISLKGIYDHSQGPDGWDQSFNLWHIGRPISGAIAGLMTVVLLKAINGEGQLTTPVVYAAAFIFGTQERRFFNFLYEVARLIVQVPEDAKAKGLRVTDIQPAEGTSGDVVVITGQGLSSSSTVKLGGAAVEKLAISADGSSAAGIIPARPLGADAVDVVVADNTGMSFTLPKKFKFTA